MKTPFARHAPPPIRQRGASLVIAVFLLVVIAGLVAATVRVAVVQQASSGLDLLGSQAYQAARSGLEWGIYHQLRVKQPASVACFASPQRFSFPAASTLSKFAVTVSCTAKAGNAVGDTTNRWTIVAVACNLPPGSACGTSTSAEYVERRVQAELN